MKKSYYLFKKKKSIHLVGSVFQDPGSVRRNARKHIWETLGAGYTPRDNALLASFMRQRTTGVSHAHADACGAGRTDRIVMDAGCVHNVVAASALCQGDYVHVDPLHMVWQVSWVLKITNTQLHIETACTNITIIRILRKSVPIRKLGHWRRNQQSFAPTLPR